MSLEEVIATAVRAAVREETRPLREALERLTPPTGDYLTPIEAGKVAGVHPETIRQWVRDGRLPKHKAGREYRIRRDELDAFLAGPDGPAGPDDDDAAAAAMLAKLRRRE